MKEKIENIKEFVKNHKTGVMVFSTALGMFVCYKVGTRRPSFWLFKNADFYLEHTDDEKEVILTLIKNPKASVGTVLGINEARDLINMLEESVKEMEAVAQ